MTQTLLPDNELAAIPEIERKHRWDNEHEKRIAACEFKDGNGRNIKSCRFCGMLRVTVMPPQGFPWHEWRTSEGQIWVGEATPPCRGEVK